MAALAATCIVAETSILGIQSSSYSCVQAKDIQHFHRRTFSEKYYPCFFFYIVARASILGIQSSSYSCVQAKDIQHFHRRIFSEKYYPCAFYCTLLLKPLSWESNLARTVACKLRTSNFFIEGHRQVISLTAGPRFFFLSLRHTKWFIRKVQE